MMGALSLGLCMFVSLMNAGGQQHNIYKGDVCNLTAGQPWRCKLLSECPTALASLRQGQWPELCNFDGDKAVACCEPSPVGAMATSMCRKYAESVFMTCNGVSINMCATVQPMIIRGMKTAPREFPHMALIGYEYDNEKVWLCGGSLISERYVLSAGHCTEHYKAGPAKWVRLGEFNKNSDKDDISGLSRPVDCEIIERINHPKYYALDNGANFYDIALYKLKKVVVFSHYIRPICLNTELKLGTTEVIATGWGKTEKGPDSDVLQKVPLSIIEPDKCSKMWDMYRGRHYDIDHSSMICAHDTISGRDTCKGDSGGPLQVLLTEPYCMYSQVGITSFGPICPNDTSVAGVYTRVSHFIPWIEKIVWP